MQRSLRVANTISRTASRAGVTDRDLAARAGISRAHLNRIKNGRTIPRVDTAIAIAKGLGCSVKTIFTLRVRR